MKKPISVLSLSTVMIFCVTLLCGCGTTQTEPRITQVAIIDTLLGGMYDGSATVAQLKSWGNLGIGTMHQLDGEMLVVDGVVYQVKYDGTVNRPADSETIPFATVVNFVPTKKIQLKKHQIFQGFRKTGPSIHCQPERSGRDPFQR